MVDSAHHLADEPGMPKTGILKRVGDKLFFMRKIYGILLIILGLLTSAIVINAQSSFCIPIYSEAVPLDPQSGPYNYFGIKVSIDQTYDQNITIEGYVYDEGSPSTNNPYSLTITAGNLSAETTLYFYQTGATENAVTSINLVTPTTVTKNGITYGTYGYTYNCGFYLEEFFLSMDYEVLEDSTSSEAETYLKSKNQELLNYLALVYPNSYNPDSVDTDDPMFTLAGLVHMIVEGDPEYEESPQPLSLAVAGPQMVSLYDSFNYSLNEFQLFNKKNDAGHNFVRLSWSCVGGVLAGIISFDQVIQSFQSLVATNGSWSSIRSLLWSILRRYATWIAVGFAIYQIGTQCL